MLYLSLVIAYLTSSSVISSRQIVNSAAGISVSTDEAGPAVQDIHCDPFILQSVLPHLR